MLGWCCLTGSSCSRLDSCSILCMLVQWKMKEACRLGWCLLYERFQMQLLESCSILCMLVQWR